MTIVQDFNSKHEEYLTREGFIKTIDMQMKKRYKRTDDIVIDIEGKNHIQVTTRLADGIKYRTIIEPSDKTDIFKRLIGRLHIQSKDANRKVYHERKIQQHKRRM